MKEVYKFSGAYCTPCKLMIPTWKAIKSLLNEKAIFHEIDIESDEITTRDNDVVSVPTFIVKIDGKEVGRKTGIITKENLEKFILQF